MDRNRKWKGSDMPKLSEEFAGNWIKAEDLKGNETTLTIKAVEFQTFKNDDGGSEKKVILKFLKTDRCLICNFVNRETVKTLYGDETDDWVGRRVTLYPTRVQFGNKMVAAIRIRDQDPDSRTTGGFVQPAPAAAAPASSAASSPVRAPVDASAISEDPEIPF